MSWGPRNTSNFPLPHPPSLAKALPPFCGGLWLQNAESTAMSWGSERLGPSAWWEGPGGQDGMQRCLLKPEELTCCSPTWHLVGATPETGFLRGWPPGRSKERGEKAWLLLTASPPNLSPSHFIYKRRDSDVGAKDQGGDTAQRGRDQTWLDSHAGS